MDKKNTTQKKNDSNPQIGFFNRWNVGATYPELDRIEKENENVVSLDNWKFGRRKSEIAKK